MAESLRIAFVTPRFAPQAGGAETYTRFVLGAMAAAGHEVEVITGAGPGLPPSDRIDGVSVRRVGPRRRDGLTARGLWLPGFARAAIRALEDVGPEAVVAQYSALLPASRYARRAGVPLVALVHAVFQLGKLVRTRGLVAGALRYAFVERLITRVRPDAVVTPSHATAREVRPMVRAAVHATGVGMDHVPDGPPASPTSMQVAFVGRLVRSKGVRDAVAAMERVRERRPGAELLVLGSGPEERRLPSWVRRHAYLEEGAFDREFRASAVLVLPSTQEGWGLVLCEAAARGVPYVAYDIPAVREQHEILEGGVLVPPGDVDALAGALERILSDPELGRRLGATGRDRAGSRLRWRDAGAALESAIRQAISHRERIPSS